MNDIDEEDGVVVDGTRQGDNQSVVPDGRRVAFFVHLGGALVLGIDPNDGVWAGLAVSPVDVLEILGRGNGYLNFVARRHCWEKMGI